MGLFQSIQQQEQYLKKVRDQDFFKFKRKVIDPIYNEVTILEDQRSATEIVLKEVIYNNFDEFTRQYEQLRQRTVLNHSKILQVLGVHKKIDKEICGTFYKIQILMEYTKFTLDSDIKLRHLALQNSQNLNLYDQYFNEKDMWHLIDSLVEPLKYLEEHNLYHGNIRPSKILLFKTESQIEVTYKLAEQGLLSNVSSYVLALANQNQTIKDIYLSPVLLKTLEKQSINPKHHKYKSDVFSLGMTLLHAASLESCEDLYNYQKFSIVQEKIKSRFQSLEKRYSQVLLQFIKEMLQIDENKRCTFKELYDQLFRKNQKILKAKEECKNIKNKRKSQFSHINNKFTEFDSASVQHIQKKNSSQKDSDEEDIEKQDYRSLGDKNKEGNYRINKSKTSIPIQPIQQQREDEGEKQQQKQKYDAFDEFDDTEMSNSIKLNMKRQKQKNNDPNKIEEESVEQSMISDQLNQNNKQEQQKQSGHDDYHNKNFQQRKTSHSSEREAINNMHFQKRKTSHESQQIQSLELKKERRKSQDSERDSKKQNLTNSVENESKMESFKQINLEKINIPKSNYQLKQNAEFLERYNPDETQNQDQIIENKQQANKEQNHNSHDNKKESYFKKSSTQNGTNSQENQNENKEQQQQKQEDTNQVYQQQVLQQKQSNDKVDSHFVDNEQSHLIQEKKIQKKNNLKKFNNKQEGDEHHVSFSETEEPLDMNTENQRKNQKILLQSPIGSATRKEQKLKNVHDKNLEKEQINDKQQQQQQGNEIIEAHQDSKNVSQLHSTELVQEKNNYEYKSDVDKKIKDNIQNQHLKDVEKEKISRSNSPSQLDSSKKFSKPKLADLKSQQNNQKKELLQQQKNADYNIKVISPANSQQQIKNEEFSQIDKYYEDIQSKNQVKIPSQTKINLNQEQITQQNMENNNNNNKKDEKFLTNVDLLIQEIKQKRPTAFQDSQVTQKKQQQSNIDKLEFIYEQKYTQHVDQNNTYNNINGQPKNIQKVTSPVQIDSKRSITNQDKINQLLMKYSLSPNSQRDSNYGNDQLKKKQDSQSFIVQPPQSTLIQQNYILSSGSFIQQQQPLQNINYLQKQHQQHQPLSFLEKDSLDFQFKFTSPEGTHSRASSQKSNQKQVAQLFQSAEENSQKLKESGLQQQQSSDFLQQKFQFQTIKQTQEITIDPLNQYNDLKIHSNQQNNNTTTTNINDQKFSNQDYHDYKNPYSVASIINQYKNNAQLKYSSENQQKLIDSLQKQEQLRSTNVELISPSDKNKQYQQDIFVTINSQQKEQNLLSQKFNYYQINNNNVFGNTNQQQQDDIYLQQQKVQEILKEIKGNSSQFRIQEQQYQPNQQYYQQYQLNFDQQHNFQFKN